MIRSKKVCDFYAHAECISSPQCKVQTITLKNCRRSCGDTNNTIKCDGQKDRWTNGCMTEGKTICPTPLCGGDVLLHFIAGVIKIPHLPLTFIQPSLSKQIQIKLLSKAGKAMYHIFMQTFTYGTQAMMRFKCTENIFKLSCMQPSLNAMRIQYRTFSLFWSSVVTPIDVY